jgi:hypothetical protein
MGGAKRERRTEKDTEKDREGQRRTEKRVRRGNTRVCVRAKLGDMLISVPV